MTVELSSELRALIEATTPPGSVISTLSQRKPNWVMDVTADGVHVETESSRAKGVGPQLIEGWMLQAAWDHLNETGELTNVELVASDGLNVKRSAGVCAILARFPQVEVTSTSPIRLRLRR